MRQPKEPKKRKKKTYDPVFADGSVQMELEFTEDGKHEIVRDQLWEDHKAVEFIKKWNSQCPPASTVPVTPWGKNKGKAAGKPSHAIERERGVVT